MTVYPCAKINIGLNIVSKRPDGYHDLQTVFCPVGIFDELTITETGRVGQTHHCMLQADGLQIEGSPQKNLVVQAYNLLSEIYKLPAVSVKLVKRIPMQAGLGGGSADCAYMIRALNKMFGLGMQMPEMQAVAARLGADCAFFINPAPSYAEGIGDKLQPVPLDLNGYKIAIVKPPVAISTKAAFANITPKKPKECCLETIKRPVETWKHFLVNDFEQSISVEYPVIGDIKQKLYGLGALYAAMSGSGSALFGIFSDEPKTLSKEFEDCFTAVIQLTAQL